MAEIGVSAGARRDYAEALRWYADRSVDAATRFDNALSELFEAIAVEPDRFPSYDGRHRFAIMRTFPYRVVFRRRGEEVTVVAIAHHSREPNYWRW